MINSSQKEPKFEEVKVRCFAKLQRHALYEIIYSISAKHIFGRVFTPADSFLLSIPIVPILIQIRAFNYTAVVVYFYAVL